MGPPEDADNRFWYRRRRYHPFPIFDRGRINTWRIRGRHRRVSVWRRKDEVISIFVDNINQRTTAENIRSLFEDFGEVCDVFISRKKRVSNNNFFGFVKMKGPLNAYRAINQMKGRWIDNSRLFVKEARFKLQGATSGKLNGKASVFKSRNGLAKKVDKPGNGRSTVSQDSLEPIGEEKIVKAQINPSMVEELERSLIGECEEPRSVEVLSQTLTNQWRSISKVRNLGPYKFLVTFVEKEDMEHALQMENSPLMQYFSLICQWDIYQQGDIRRVWLEVMGIPPQVWSRDTCVKIATKFGVLVCCDSSFDNPDSFVTCRMMIDTNIMSNIADVLYLSIDEHCIGKAIYVREGSTQTTCFIKQAEPNRSLSWHQWDDTVSVKNNVHDGLIESERVSNEEDLDVVGETPMEEVVSSGTERTVTLVGNVHYDINEETDLISRKRSLNASLENSNNHTTSDEDCPPGFQKILNTKKFKRKSKPTVRFKRSSGDSKLKRSKKAEGQCLRDDFAGLNQVDSIEEWSQDDFEADKNAEEVKSRELGRMLGLGVGDPLSLNELLN